MTKSEKSPDMKDASKQGRKLESDELKDVTGGVFMSSSCTNRDKPECTGDPYSCGCQDGSCTFG